MGNTASFDYVIVGCGTAGALLANRLSADTANSVLVIEAGGFDHNPLLHIPLGALYMQGSHSLDWNYKTQPCTALNGRRLNVRSGKVMGGSSSTHAMQYLRGQAEDYNQWATLTGESAWTWESCLRDFIRHENNYRFDNLQSTPSDDQLWSCHGSRGEWRIEPQRVRWKILDAFVQAAQEVGIPVAEDFNKGNSEGVGYFEVSQNRGVRCNSVKAFLKPVLGKRKNLTVWTHSQGSRLRLFRNAFGRLECTGVKVLRGSEVLEVEARKEVVLCAGAVASPQLLQLSGIGPRLLLQGLGIAVQRDLKGVGQNLQDHLLLRSVYQVKNAPTLNTSLKSVRSTLKMALDYALHRKGPLAMPLAQLGIFSGRERNATQSDLHLAVQAFSQTEPGQSMHRFDAVTVYASHLRPSSRGSVKIHSANSQIAPFIDPNYLGTDEDKKAAIRALRLTRKIASQPALAGFVQREVLPGEAFQSDDDLAEQIATAGFAASNFVGTAKMGADSDDMAVVDAHLRVRGVQRLRVADSSVIPTLVSAHASSTTLVVAEKAARWILASD
ncbi:MAG: choline dehydrogenase [Limnobacter sp.]|nr:choline dehydrogenase [Limnobacter sp.]